MNKKFVVHITVILVLLLAAAGCGELAIENDQNDANDHQQRIISLMPSNTEILFELGLGESVVGVTDYCNYPPEMEAAVADGRIMRVGDAFSINEELIISLDPTLVLLGFENETLIESLEGYGIATAVISPRSIEAAMDSLLTIGELTGRRSEAESLVAEMKSAFDQISSKTAGIADSDKPRVLMLLDLDFLFVAGNGTIEDELITLAGGINVIEIAGYDSVSEEFIVESQPEIILSSFPYREIIMAEKEAWQDLPAVQNEAIYDLDGDLINRPTPRLVEGLKMLLQLLHPGL